MAATVNPLDNSGATSLSVDNVRVPDLPSLREQIQSKGLMQGVEAFDEAMRQWRSELEKAINEQRKNSAPVPSGKLS